MKVRRLKALIESDVVSIPPSTPPETPLTFSNLSQCLQVQPKRQHLSTKRAESSNLVTSVVLSPVPAQVSEAAPSQVSAVFISSSF